MRRTIEWTIDSLGDRFDCWDTDEIDALAELPAGFDTLLAPLAEAWNQYSDGRPVMTRVEIEEGCTFEHLWHPDPSQDSAQTVTGRLMADPGQDNGGYVITILPPSALVLELTPPKAERLQIVPGGVV
ncbi:hypothetical protein [Nocardia sp. NPDC059239]